MRKTLVAVILITSLAPPATAVARPNDVSATRYFRARAAKNYHGPVALGDGRGCAKAKRWLFICTAHVRATNAQIYGTVTVSNRAGVHGIGGFSMTTVGGGSGNKITEWFSHTDGGCQTNDCAGTVYHRHGDF
jgi:hypothetical protein